MQGRCYRVILVKIFSVIIMVMIVMIMLVHTDSVMPRKFSSDSATMNRMATSVTGTPSTNDVK